jgi:hypothetical protein
MVTGVKVGDRVQFRFGRTGPRPLIRGIVMRTFDLDGVAAVDVLADEVFDPNTGLPVHVITAADVCEVTSR